MYLISAHGSFIFANHFHTQLSLRGDERAQPGPEPRGEEQPVLTFKPVLEIFLPAHKWLNYFSTGLFKTCY